jgi:hypothetical protein
VSIYCISSPIYLQLSMPISHHQPWCLLENYYPTFPPGLLCQFLSSTHVFPGLMRQLLYNAVI